MAIGRYYIDVLQAVGSYLLRKIMSVIVRYVKHVNNYTGTIVGDFLNLLCCLCDLVV